jgi:hypothetical protein
VKPAPFAPDRSQHREGRLEGVASFRSATGRGPNVDVVVVGMEALEQFMLSLPDEDQQR